MIRFFLERESFRGATSLSSCCLEHPSHKLKSGGLAKFGKVSEKIYAGKMKWKTSELEYTTGSNIPSCGSQWRTLPDGEMVEIKFVEELVVLGTSLDRKGTTTTSMQHRLSKAEGCYGGMAELLKDRGTPGKERLEAWGSLGIGEVR